MSYGLAKIGIVAFRCLDLRLTEVEEIVKGLVLDPPIVVFIAESV
jgi:hypothetical protein